MTWGRVFEQLVALLLASHLTYRCSKISDLVRQINPHGRKFVSHLCVNNRPDLLKVCLMHSDPPAEDLDAAFLIAVAHGHYDCMGHLIDKGVDVNVMSMNPMAEVSERSERTYGSR